MTASPGGHRRLAHPLAPVLLLAAAAAALAIDPVEPAAEPLTWAVLGGLAGYSLSGSV